MALSKLESWPHKDRLVGAPDRKQHELDLHKPSALEVQSVGPQEFEHAGRDLGAGVQIVSRPPDQILDSKVAADDP
jgi:hypothetical protein